MKLVVGVALMLFGAFIVPSGEVKAEPITWVKACGMNIPAACDGVFAFESGYIHYLDVNVSDCLCTVIAKAFWTGDVVVYTPAWVMCENRGDNTECGSAPGIGYCVPNTPCRPTALNLAAAASANSKGKYDGAWRACIGNIGGFQPLKSVITSEVDPLCGGTPTNCDHATIDELQEAVMSGNADAVLVVLTSGGC